MLEQYFSATAASPDCPAIQDAISRKSFSALGEKKTGERFTALTAPEAFRQGRLCRPDTLANPRRKPDLFRQVPHR